MCDVLEIRAFVPDGTQEPDVQELNIGFCHVLTALHADEFVAKRAKVLRDVIHKHGGNKDAELPVALIENSSRAPTNDAGEKLLGNKRAWLPDLMTKVTIRAPVALHKTCSATQGS